MLYTKDTVTVAQLIEQLQKLEPTLPVVAFSHKHAIEFDRFYEASAEPSPFEDSEDCAVLHFDV